MCNASFKCKRCVGAMIRIIIPYKAAVWMYVYSAPHMPSLYALARLGVRV